MNKIKKYLISFVTIFLIFSMIGAASDDIYPNNTKFSIKTKTLGIDKDWSVVKIQVNISSDKSGNFTYIENYYSRGSEQPKYHSSRNYNGKLKNDEQYSFEIARLKTNKLGNPYYFIESIVILNGDIIFKKWSNLTDNFRLNYNNYKDFKEKNKLKNNKTDTLKNKEDEFHKNMTEYEDNITNIPKDETLSDANKKISGFEIIMIVISISMVYTLKRKIRKVR